MPLTPEDHMAVQDLIASYAEYLDEGNLSSYIGNFAPDGIFENRRGSLAGRDAIRAWVGELLSGGGAGSRSTLRHVMGLPVIRGEGDRCTARTYVMITRLNADGDIGIAMVGTYRDVCVKIDGRWYFEKRSIFMDLTSASHSQSRGD